MIKLIDILSESVKKHLIKEEEVNGKFPSPLPGIRYSYRKSEYDWTARRDYGAHHAADIPAPSGTVFRSPMDATVTDVTTSFTKPCGGFIRIRNSNNLVMSFCHVRKFFVSVGDVVRPGDPLGEVGGGDNDPYRGRSDGPHLHFKIRTGGNNGPEVKPWDYVDFTKGFSNSVGTPSSVPPSPGESITDRIQRLRDEGMSNLSIASLLGIDVAEVEAKLEDFRDNLSDYNKMIGQEYDYDDTGGVVSPPRDYENTMDDFNSYVEDMFSEYEKNDMQDTDVEMIEGQEFFVVKRKNGKKRYYFYKNNTFVPTNL
jgi:biotin carboxyl carrier protein